MASHTTPFHLPALGRHQPLYVAYDGVAETCVFGKQSLEPAHCGPLTQMGVDPPTLPGHPFFRRYGVNLPSSLTEDRSSTLGFLPLPTCVGVRYGPCAVASPCELAARGFSWRPGHHTPSDASAAPPVVCANCFAAKGPDLPGPRPRTPQPPLSIRTAGASCRVPPSPALSTGAGISYLLAIAYAP